MKSSRYILLDAALTVSIFVLVLFRPVILRAATAVTTCPAALFTPHEHPDVLLELAHLRVAIDEARRAGETALATTLAKQYRLKLKEAAAAQLPLNEVAELVNESSENLQADADRKMAEKQKVEADERKFLPLIEMQTLKHSHTVTSAQFSPTGELVVTSSDTLATIWDAETGRELKVLKGHGQSVNSAVFSPDGKKILTASEDHTVRLWDVQTGKQLQVLSGFLGKITRALFTADQKTIVISTADTTITFWDAATAQQKMRFSHEEDKPGFTNIGLTIAKLASGDAHLISAGFNHVVLWDLTNERRLLDVPSFFGADGTTFSPDGKHLAVISESMNSALIYETKTGKKEITLNNSKDALHSVQFSPDGTLIMCHTLHSVRFYDATSGKLVQRLPFADQRLGVPRFSGDSATVLVSTNNKYVGLWDIGAAKEIQTLPHSGQTPVLVVSPSDDGNSVLIIVKNNVIVWGRPLKDRSK